jgi:ubiquinone/menaquinone biosynthesis C-methylase UbiE
MPPTFRSNASPTLRQRFSREFGTQLGNPRGLFGALIGKVIFTKGNAPFNQWVVEQLAITPTSQILEVGSGPGVTLQALAARAPEGHVIGIDRSGVMIRQAQQRNAAAIQAGRVDVRLGDASALPFPDRSFDIVVAIHVLYFWSDAVATLQELRRVLQPGGVVAIGFALKQHAPAATQFAFDQTGATLPTTSQDVVRLLEAAGFTQVRTVQQEKPTRVSGICAFGQY